MTRKADLQAAYGKSAETGAVIELLLAAEAELSTMEDEAVDAVNQEHEAMTVELNKVRTERDEARRELRAFGLTRQDYVHLEARLALVTGILTRGQMGWLAKRDEREAK